MVDLYCNISRCITYIQQAGKSNEKDLGMKKLQVDGWCEETQTAFEYDATAVITTDMTVSPSKQTFRLWLHLKKELKK